MTGTIFPAGQYFNLYWYEQGLPYSLEQIYLRLSMVLGDDT